MFFPSSSSAHKKKKMRSHISVDRHLPWH
jgi:hypothetical protein